MKFKVMSCNGFADKIIYLIYLVKNFQRYHTTRKHLFVEQKLGEKIKRDDGYPDSMKFHVFSAWVLCFFNNERNIKLLQFDKILFEKINRENYFWMNVEKQKNQTIAQSVSRYKEKEKWNEQILLSKCFVIGLRHVLSPIENVHWYICIHCDDSVFLWSLFVNMNFSTSSVCVKILHSIFARTTTFF